MYTINLPKLMSVVIFSLFALLSVEAEAAIVTGNGNGSIVVEEFFDYQCPHCRTMLEVTEQVAQSNHDVKLVTRVVPLLDKNSWFIARAALAARKQGKYAALHHLLMHQRSYITEDRVMSLARSAGINIVLLQREMRSKAIMAELSANVRDSRSRGVEVIPAIFAYRTDKRSGELRFVGDKSYSELQTSLTNL
jgi:protein-disulfide isomerase